MKSVTARLVLLGLLTVASLASAASSDDENLSPDLIAGAPVDIQVAVGFSGIFRLGRWTPVMVTVENRSANLIGHLEVRVPDGDELGAGAFTTTHRRNLELPAGARKRLHFTVFLQSFSRPLVIRVTSDASEVAKRVVDLRHAVTDARLLLVLGRDADLDYLNDDLGRRLRVVYPRPERLPDHWAGYDSVAALVVHGVALESLSRRQHQALRKWLARGGVMVVSGGPDYSLLRTPRLAGLLPGVPVGLARVTDTAAVGEALGIALLADKPFDVNRVPGFVGRLRYHTREAALVLERDHGRGRVVYLTFDIARYPFATWSGMSRLWHTLLDLPPVRPLSAQLEDTRESSTLPTLIRASRHGFPDHPTVLVFLALYLGLLATAYRLRPVSKRGRRLLHWLGWAWPILFAPAAYWVFGPLLFPAGATAVVAAVIEPYHLGPLANLKLEIGLFSNATTPLQLDYRAPEPTIRLRGSSRPSDAAVDWVHQDGVTARSVQPQTRARYVLHLLEGHDVISYDLAATLTEGPEDFRLDLQNNSGRRLTDAWLVLDRRAYPLGAVPVDAEWARRLEAGSDGRALHDRSWRKLLGDHGGLDAPELDARSDIVSRELSAHHKQGRDFERAVLFGFSASPLRLDGASATWRRQELTLVVLRVPVTRLPRAASGPRPSSGPGL